jgi:hypothetical protein
MGEIEADKIRALKSVMEERDRIIGYTWTQPDMFAGLWHDGGSDFSVVVAFTQDLERHCAALRSLVSDPELFKVVQRRFTHQHLRDVQSQIVDILGSSEGLTLWGVDPIRSVVVVNVLPGHFERVRLTLATTNPDDVVVEPGSAVRLT